MTKETAQDLIELFDHCMIDDNLVSNPIALILDNSDLTVAEAKQFRDTYSPYYTYGDQKIDEKLLAKMDARLYKKSRPDPELDKILDQIEDELDAEGPTVLCKWCNKDKHSTQEYILVSRKTNDRYKLTICKDCTESLAEDGLKLEE